MARGTPLIAQRLAGMLEFTDPDAGVRTEHLVGAYVKSVTVDGLSYTFTFQTAAGAEAELVITLPDISGITAGNAIVSLRPSDTDIIATFEDGTEQTNDFSAWFAGVTDTPNTCLLYTSPSPRDS